MRYSFIVILLLLQFHRFTTEYVKCSNCKYVIREKYKLINGNIHHIPQQCKLFRKFIADKNSIKKEYLDTNTRRSHFMYCGKNGTFYTE
jgi:hypothetical protein